MRCSCVQCRFSALIDRDLDPDDEAELLEHLGRCDECSRELAAMKEYLAAVRSLPAEEPGPDFFECVKRQVHAAGERFAEERRGRFGFGRWFPDTSRLWLRPAFGLALGLVAGVLVTARAPQLTAFLGGGAQETGPTSALTVYEETAADIARNQADSSPFAGIDLPPLRSDTDSMRYVAEPEYVLAPWVADPSRGLVPAGGGYGRTAGTETDAQNDVFITF